MLKNLRTQVLTLVGVMAGLTQTVMGAYVVPQPPGHVASDTWPPGTPIRLCAIRVEFAQDSITGTTGSGRMNSWFPDSLRIDPLPHDKMYFQDHLAFLEDYFSTASKSAVTFSSLDVYPASDSGTYQLAHPMWHYNYNSDRDLLNQRLVELYVESVYLADPDVDFSSYDAVIVFHAGVGKDFNFGYDATPFDIPSAYISPEDLQNYHGDVALPVGLAAGLILPEGENQQEALDFGVELSLNGIMVKLFGNWLGMPDLFDTRTGRSGIGRWGMMDQGSGNLGALVPALPDAWSRVFMGWQESFTDIPSSSGDSLSVARFNVPGAPEVVKLPVTPREYFLMENRAADPDSLGYVELRDRDQNIMRVDPQGEILETIGDFRVAVSASNYDFGIPGSGLLIWHIDEDVIDAGLSTNTVNNNPNHRGVDLVEADGAQDIGQEYGFASAGSGAELGVPEDAWYAGNDANRAANGYPQEVRWNDRTFPSTKLYDGAFTNLSVSNFSTIAAVMTVNARVTNVLAGYPVAVRASHQGQWSVVDLDGDSTDEFVVQRDSALDVFRIDGTLMGSVTLAEPWSLPSSYRTGFDVDDNGREELPINGVQAGVLELSDTGLVVTLGYRHDGFFSDLFPGRTVEGTPIWVDRQRRSSGVTDTVVLAAYDVAMDSLYTSVITDGGADVPFLNVESLPSSRFVLQLPNNVTCLEFTDTGVYETWNVPTSGQGKVQILAEPDRRFVFIDEYGYVDALDGSPVCSAGECDPPSIDWDGDGIPEGGGRFGRNQTPQENPIHLTGIPAKWDYNADGKPDELTLDVADPESAGHLSGYTRVYAAEHAGELFDGFPLAASAAQAVSLPGLDITHDSSLYFVSVYGDSGNYEYALCRIPITSRSNVRFAYTEPASIINVGPLRPQVHNRVKWLYCWPNPANSTSHIRITLPYPSRANVKVFDLAGRKVAELAGSSDIAGAYQVLWDVSGIESGVYIGKVSVNGDAVSDHAEVKIAVVK